MSVNGEIEQELVDIRGDITVVLRGEDGLSAYEVAVRNGFAGTEAEWLESLKGEARTTERYTQEAEEYWHNAQGSSIVAGNYAAESARYRNEAQEIKDSFAPEVFNARAVIQAEKEEAEQKKLLVDEAAENAQRDREQADADAAEVRYLYNETINQKNVATDAAERARQYAEGAGGSSADAQQYAMMAEASAQQAGEYEEQCNVLWENMKTFPDTARIYMENAAQSASEAQTLCNESEALRNESAILRNESEALRDENVSLRDETAILKGQAETAQQAAETAQHATEVLEAQAEGYRDEAAALEAQARHHMSVASYEAFQAHNSAMLASSEAYQAQLYRDEAQGLLLDVIDHHNSVAALTTAAADSARSAAAFATAAADSARAAATSASEAYEYAQLAGASAELVQNKIEQAVSESLEIHLDGKLDVNATAVAAVTAAFASTATTAIHAYDADTVNHHHVALDVPEWAIFSPYEVKAEVPEDLQIQLDSKLGALATAVNAERVNGLTVETPVPPNAVFTDTTYEVMGSSELEEGISIDGKLISAHTLATFILAVAADVVNNAPEALDTLAELAQALGNDPNFATTVMTEIGKKLNKAGDTMTGNLAVQGSVTATSFAGPLTGNVTGNASTSTKTTGDKNGNDITTKYVNVDGEQVISGQKTITQGLKMRVTDTNSSTTRDAQVLHANSSNTAYGINVAFGANGNTIVGSGESYSAQLNALAANSGEDLYLTADGNIYLKPNSNTWANAKTITLNTSGELSGLAKVTATAFAGALTGNVTGNCSGTSANVTGTIAIANGGTGATSRLNAVKGLTNENVGSGATYFLTITTNWAKAGYSSVADAKTALGINNVNNTADANKSVSKAATLTTARTIDGVSFDGSANITHYGSCSTAAATAAKVVACTGFTLATGAKIAVKFTVTNTAASPTLNVNSTGAKAIYYRGAAITAGYLAANRTYEFVYNGTQYELVGDVDTNSDTHWTSHLYAGGSGATANAATSNGGTYLSLCDNSTNRNNIKIIGSGATTVTSDANGVITINSTNTNTDTLMTQNVSSTNATYPLLMCPTADATANQGAKTGIFSSKIKANASTGAMSLNGKTVAVVSSFSNGTLALVSSGS